MLKITTAIHTESGATIATGSVIEYSTNFVPTRVPVLEDGVVIGAKAEVAAHFNLNVWVKAADWEDGVTPKIAGLFKEFGIGYVYPFSDEQWAEIESNTGEFAPPIFAAMEGLLISALEDGWGSYSGVGAGNVEHFTPVEAEPPA